ncbi:MAG: alpha/beta hydrolase, partial [Firmicutes bacterium]|nr:alpha/beta hydrolase [Bacillota bacterium]
MALDPQAKALLDLIKERGGPPMHLLSPQENRLALRRSAKRMNIPPPTVAHIQDRLIPVRDGEISVRLYRPAAADPLPIFIFFHGGGFIMGDLDTVDPPLRAIANAVPALVISVDYRLAPEYQFPTAVEDCYAALEWSYANAGALGGDPARIAVGGDSAGGNLAAVMSLLAREQGGPHLCAQLLLYPAVDQLNYYPSHDLFAEGYFISLADIVQIRNYYCKTAADKKHICASPILAPDLSILPDALVVTAGYDPLRDEGEAYAKRLEEAGVKVDYHCYTGMIHGFFGMSGLLDQGKVLIR